MASAAGSRAASMTSVAGRGPPSRALTNCIVRVAAAMPTKAGLNSRPASCIWVSSRRIPSLFNARKISSIRHLKRYRRTISCASSAAAGRSGRRHDVAARSQSSLHAARLLRSGRARRYGKAPQQPRFEPILATRRAPQKGAFRHAARGLAPPVQSDRPLPGIARSWRGYRPPDRPRPPPRRPRPDAPPHTLPLPPSGCSPCPPARAWRRWRRGSRPCGCPYLGTHVNTVAQ